MYVYMYVVKQNDYVRMTFPENSSLQFIRTAPLSMVTLNTESQNPMDCLYVKSPGNQWVKLATFMGTPTSVLFRSSQRFWVFGYPGSFSFTYTVFWCHNMGFINWFTSHTKVRPSRQEGSGMPIYLTCSSLDTSIPKSCKFFDTEYLKLP